MPVVTEAMAQHQRALRQANDVRRERARLKRRVSASRIRGGEFVAELLLDVPAAVARMEILALMCWVPRWGTRRASLLLDRLEITSSRHVEELTLRQRKAIATALSADRRVA